MATAPLVTLRGIPSIPKLGDDGGDDDPTKVDRTPPPPPAPVRTPRRATRLSSVPPPRESDVRALAPKHAEAKRPVPRPATRLTPSTPPSSPAPLNVRAPMSSCPTEPIDASCIEEVLAAVDRPRAQTAPPPLPSTRPPAPSVDVAALFDARPRALVLLLTVAWFVRHAAVAAFHRSVVLFAEAKVGARAAWTTARAQVRQR